MTLLPLGAVALHLGFNRAFGFSSGFLKNPLRDEGMFTLFFTQFAERAPEVLRYYATEVLFEPRLVFVQPEILSASHTLGMSF